MEKHQGKYHLLAIFFLPAILVSGIVLKNWLLTGLLGLLLIGLIIVIFRK